MSKVIVLLLFCHAQAVYSLDMPMFLIGTWKVKDKNSYEQWESVDKLHLSGISYKLEDGKKNISENISISKNNAEVVYSATVLNQNDGTTIDFIYKPDNGSTYVFVNQDHDFPNYISYQLESHNVINVNVSGNNGEGFDYQLIKQVNTKKIPQWFMVDLKNNIGIWTADNSQYMSDQEPQQQYVLQWQWGLGKTSITGRLYGIIAGQETGDYWHFRQYWDSNKGQAILAQFGHNNMNGIGEISPIDNGRLETIQIYSSPSTVTATTKHISLNDGQVNMTTSFNQNTDGSWQKDRSYLWHKSN